MSDERTGVDFVDEWMDRLRAAEAAAARAAGRTIEEHRAFVDAKVAADEAKRARVAEAQALARFVEASHIPARFADILAGELAETPVLVDVREWVTGGGWALVLSGGVGVGKTVAALWALYSTRRGVYVTARALVAPRALDALEEARKADLVVLDDMGDEAMTDIGGERLRGLLTDRHADGARTIITTNLNLGGAGGWVERYGSRLVDRLMEGGAFKGYSGQSLRGQQGLRLVP